jgi:amino acid transporter
VGSTHKHNLTPHFALTIFAVIQFLIPTAFMLIAYAGGWQADGICIPFDAFNAAGLFGAMGFSGAYVLICLATPFYLAKIGELKAWHIVVCVLAELLLVVPIVGLVYPKPPFPADVQPYIYGGYLVIGVVLVLMRSRSRKEIEEIRKVLEVATTTKPSEDVATLPADGSPAMA